MGKITLVGLGPGDPGMISIAAAKVLVESSHIYLRTEIHPVVNWLKEKNVKYQTFDWIYRQAENFQQVYRRIAREIIEMGHMGEVVYALPGHPLMAEESVDLIIKEAGCNGIEVDIIPGISFLDALIATLKIDPVEGLNIYDGLRLKAQQLQPNVGTVLIQAYSNLILSDIKLTLMDCYHDEHPVVVVTAAGIPGEEKVERCPLFQLDRVRTVNHLTSVYIPPVKEEKSAGVKYPLDPLVDTMKILRSDNGCPWDREQDHLTLRKYLLEEAYELLEALDKQDMYNTCEELGDLLLQIVFHAQIASESGYFDINDVVESITEKMVRRHPHVFGSVKVNNSTDVALNWEAIKRTEKSSKEENSLLDGVPESYSSLMKAQKIQSKASKVGFDWEDYNGALVKVYEELVEIREAISADNKKHMESELGDVLFAIVNLARLLDIDAESALAGTVNKFRRRFRHIEKEASRIGQKLSDISIEKKEIWWEESKKLEKTIKKEE